MDTGVWPVRLLEDRGPVSTGLLSSDAGWLLKQAVGLHGSDTSPEAGTTHIASMVQDKTAQQSTAQHRQDKTAQHHEQVVSHAADNHPSRTASK
jgi:nicotinamide mononucleotide (NMN) deamidase PncC